MWKFIGKTLAGMVLTKEARDAAGGLAKTAVRSAAQKIHNGPKPSDERDQAIAQLPSQGANPVTPDRAELIRRAMELRAAKQTLLADLNDEDRARLVATAMRAFLTESKPKE